MNKGKQCILCPYKKEEDCLFKHDKCYSLSNIYHGILCKFFPFKQIENLKDEITSKRYAKYCQEANEKYGDFVLEDDDFKFIFGVKSYDDLSKCDANMYTMNDVDITYDKNKKVYMLGIETAYIFKDYEAECHYLKECLKDFTKYMDDNNLDKNRKYRLFMNDCCTNMIADTIEELYTNFRIFVNGYCSLDEV